MSIRKSHERLYDTLGYRFQNEKLLIAALTHRSVPQNNNERLEFLGDSIVNFIAAEIVYKQFQLADEGELSRLRTKLVRGETLALLARRLAIGDYLYLGPGEMRSGGAKRESILADALEAVVAALYLDAGVEICKKVVSEWFAPLVLELLGHEADKDPKTHLQEYLQSILIALPQYRVIDISGKAHAQIFTVECAIADGKHIALGKGTSRRRAEQQSAEIMLAELTHGKKNNG
ncbi:MAG: ribonuclease III [Gammaproteobacteria bacterium]|nr:ribonuclease III [Gammaproteobacteria bacterium]